MNSFLMQNFIKKKFKNQKIKKKKFSQKNIWNNIQILKIIKTDFENSLKYINKLKINLNTHVMIFFMKILKS